MADSTAATAFPYPILIGDIGGTNARFAILLEPSAAALPLPTVRTADYATIDDAIRQAVMERAAVLPRSAVLAVAGPVDGDEIELTNCPWVVRPRALIGNLGFRDILVLNDFEAQALAVTALGEADMARIGGGAPEAGASCVVLGPGTGLGVAGLVRAAGLWIPVPGEGGHVDIGPRNAREEAIFSHVERIEGRVSAEQILCGRGLVNLARAVAAADGRPAVHAAPADVTAAALAGDDPVAVETLALFCVLLGRLAGDMALVFMARGGVYLTGGISQKILSALVSGGFRAAFDDKAPHRALMRAMPVSVVTHPFAPLAGLAAYAHAPARYGINTAGRRWQA